MVLRAARGGRFFAQLAGEKPPGDIFTLFCVSERKERDSDAAECRFSPGCCCFLSVSLAIVKRGNPAFTAFASEIILALRKSKSL